MRSSSGARRGSQPSAEKRRTFLLNFTGTRLARFRSLCRSSAVDLPDAALLGRALQEKSWARRGRETVWAGAARPVRNLFDRRQARFGRELAGSGDTRRFVWNRFGLELLLGPSPQRANLPGSLSVRGEFRDAEAGGDGVLM